MKFNVNEYVKVKLTDRGKKILSAEGLDFYHKPDKDGWSSWQLWHLMETFGKHISMSSFPPFETEIEILHETQ